MKYIVKQCPFCRNVYEEEFMIEEMPSYPTELKLVFHRVACSCGATGPTGGTREEAIKRWNKRVKEREKRNEKDNG